MALGSEVIGVFKHIWVFIWVLHIINIFPHECIVLILTEGTGFMMAAPCVVPNAYLPQSETLFRNQSHIFKSVFEIAYLSQNAKLTERATIFYSEENHNHTVEIGWNHLQVFIIFFCQICPRLSNAQNLWPQKRLPTTGFLNHFLSLLIWLSTYAHEHTWKSCQQWSHHTIQAY